MLGDVLFSKGKNDEMYTPRYGVEPIIKHLPKGTIIWCPFDRDEHNFPIMLREAGFTVINSHIDYGEDFYTYEPEKWDVIVSNPPFCFDEKTEILTNEGWKNFETLSYSDKVLSVNPHTQMIEWSDILDINIQYYEGDMLSFKSKTMDLLVTPYHRMFAHKYSKKTHILVLNKSKSDLIEASNITPKYHKQLRTGYKWQGKNQNTFTIPSTEINNGHTMIYKDEIHIDMNKWLAFFGLWLADGYCRHTLNSQGNQRYTCGIKQSDINKDCVISILDNLPFNYKIYQEKGTDKANYEIHSKQLWEYLIQFGKSKNKYIPNQLKNLSKEQLLILLDCKHSIQYILNIIIILGKKYKYLYKNFEELKNIISFVTNMHAI